MRALVRTLVFFATLVSFGDLSAQEMSLKEAIQSEHLIQVLGAEDWGYYNQSLGWSQRFDLDLKRDEETFWVSKDTDIGNIKVAAPPDIAAFLVRICGGCEVTTAGHTFPSFEINGSGMKPLGQGSGAPGYLVEDDGSGAVAIVPSDLSWLINKLCESCAGGDIPTGAPHVAFPKVKDCKRFPRDPRCGAKLEIEPVASPYEVVTGATDGALFWAPKTIDQWSKFDTHLYGVDYDLALDVPVDANGLTLEGDQLSSWKLDQVYELQKKRGFTFATDDAEFKSRFIAPLDDYSAPVQFYQSQ